jgi:hypothetical protein
MPIEWKPRLTKTAGLTYTAVRGGKEYLARIVLSIRVIDTPLKLAQTLLHELCHAAAWVVDHSNRPPHGPIFKKWGRYLVSSFLFFHSPNRQQWLRLYHARSLFSFPALALPVFPS